MKHKKKHHKKHKKHHKKHKEESEESENEEDKVEKAADEILKDKSEEKPVGENGEQDPQMSLSEM